MAEEEKQKDTEAQKESAEPEDTADTGAVVDAENPLDNGSETTQAGEDEAATDTDGLLREIERLKMEVQENSDKALRATAELDNVRKRTSRDIENAHRYALDKFITELLPVIDSMELGIHASESVGDVESLREGMDLTLKKFFDCLDKFGVTAIDPDGEKFNPQRHEAVSMQEAEGAQANTIITVMQKGYELNGRLVRPAMVVVAK